MSNYRVVALGPEPKRRVGVDRPTAGRGSRIRGGDPEAGSLGCPRERREGEERGNLAKRVPR